MSTEPRHPEFEAQIAADPEAVEPYIVYGDWLAQRGDARGELILVQAALATCEQGEFAELKAREWGILKKDAKRFYGPLSRARRQRVARTRWHCGFVAGYSQSEEGFVEHPSARFLQALWGSGLTEHTPLLHTLATARVAARAWALPRLRRLTIGRITKKTDFGTPAHPLLESIGLGGEIGRGVQALAGGRFPQLRSLALLGVEPPMLKRMEGLTAFPEARLEVALRPGFEDGGYRGIESWSPRIESLALDGFSGEHFASLEGATFDAVETLDVSGPDTSIRDTVFDRLPSFPALAHLRIRHPADRVGFVRALANSALSRSLERLSIQLGKPGVVKAFTEGEYPALRRLDLGFDSAGPDYVGSERVFEASLFESLETLALQRTWHLKTLVGSTLAPRLKHLDIHLDKDRDAQTLLAALPGLRGLERLTLGGDRHITEASLRALYATDLQIEWAPRLDW